MMELSFHSADMVKRRVMFALELIDPGRGTSAGREMSVHAEGFAAPSAGFGLVSALEPPLLFSSI